jgi:catechol 2,3-dioxygenase-like lactoylglutathione lyase family enzyme
MSVALLVNTPPVRFHISINVNDLARSVAFYRTLFGMEPAKLRSDYAKFEPDDPPLVLSLEPNGRSGPGTLNHLGVRLPDVRGVLAVKERLEKEGMTCRWEEGVECCYAKQTKFWLTDPDGTLWEVYNLHEDIAHRGSGRVPDEADAGLAVWEHRLGDPLPKPIPADDGALDVVRLRGSFNVPLPAGEPERMLAEVRRALKPSGRLVLRALSAEQAVTSPKLGGSGARVEYVPTKDELLGLVERAGFHAVRLTKYGDPPCFVKDGNAMRETHLEGWASPQSV